MWLLCHAVYAITSYHQYKSACIAVFCVLSCLLCTLLSIYIFVVIRPSVHGARLLQLATRMATATYGNLQKFNPDVEGIAAYLERAEIYFKANDIAESKQVHIFLSVLGGRIYSLLRDLLAPAKPDEKTFQELAEVLKNHFEPKPLVIAERYYFHTRCQKPTETIAEYVAELRRLATHCEFGEYLNDALRDRFVCGLHNSGTQKRFLAEAKLTFGKAVELAQGAEAAEKNARKLKAGDADAVCKIGTSATHKTTDRSSERACYRCGGTNHVASVCRFKDTICHKCKKKGHLAKVCRGVGRGRTQNHPTSEQRKSTHTVQESAIHAEEKPANFTLFGVGEARSHGPIVVTVEVNQQPLEMELDTGAAVSIISTSTKDQIFPSVPLISTSTILTTYTLKEAIERELDHLEAAGIVEKVTHSKWAAPIVPVPKEGGKLHLCGDYKVTINPVLEIDQYPLPKPDDLFATLAGGKQFTKIDLTHAYQRMNLEESSRELVTMNTHKGLYRYTRLPFGVASAPAMFQKTMEVVLQGLPNVICYLDDILVTGKTEDEHLANVERVLERLQQYGIQAKKAKCSFLSRSVEYLGHRVDASGLHTTPSKVQAVQKAPRPQNVQELRSFLGLVQYYGKFLPNLATLLHPLNHLLKDGCEWEWTEKCSQAFQAAKTLLVSAPVLAHYNPELPIKMAGDASAYGVGAVISHVFSDGTERPVAFASRTLSPSEQNYSQLEKEALSLVFGIQRFHQYLYGRKFSLVTDHKPLTTILGPKTGIPSMAAAHLQRLALLLSAYSYSIEFKPTQDHGNADGLLRLPLGSRQPPDMTSAFMIGQVQALPVTSEYLETVLREDPFLSQIHRYVREGWPSSTPEEYIQAIQGSSG